MSISEVFSSVTPKDKIKAVYDSSQFLLVYMIKLGFPK